MADTRWRNLRTSPLKVESVLTRVVFTASEANEATKYSTPTGARTTASTTYVSWPAAVPDIMFVPFTKIYAESSLVVQWHGTLFSTVVGSIPQFRIVISDFVNPAIATLDPFAKFFFNVANVHNSLSTVGTKIAGVPAGGWFALLQVKLTAGAQNVSVDTNDFNCLSVREVA